MAAARRTPRLLARNLVARLAQGAVYPFEALGFMRRERLWGLASAAIGINVVVLVALLVLTFTLVWPYVEHLEGWLGDWGRNSWLLGSLMAALGWLLWLLVVASVVVVNGLLLLLIGQAVASPILDLLSERVEILVLGIQPAPFTARRLLASILIALGDVFWSGVYWIAVNVPLFVLGLLLPPLAALLGFGFSALLAAQEFVGLSLARRLVSYRERWQVIRRNRAVSLGFGSVCMLLFAVPGLNLVLLPLAAVGGTLLYCDIVAGGGLSGARAQPGKTAAAL